MESSDTLRCYLASLPQLPLLSREEEQALFALVKEGDNDARTTLVLSNLRLVSDVAVRFHKRADHPIPVQDLISAGVEGLLIAIDRFDPTRGTKLGTYATWWIRLCIIKAQNAGGRTVRLPHYLYCTLSKIKGAKEQLERSTGSEPTDEDIVDSLSIDMPTYRKTVGAAFRTSPDRFEDSSFVPDPNQSVLEEHETKAALWRGLYQLDLRSLVVVLLRFGIGVGRVYKMREIATLLRLTSDRVRQVEQAALRQLEETVRV